MLLQVAELYSVMQTAGQPASLISSLTLRAAAPDDYDFALCLYLDSTKRLLTAIGRWDEKRVIGRFKQAFYQKQAQVICLSGADIGWVQVSQSDGVLHLHQLHLIEQYRNRGIGTHLIEGFCDQARREGIALMLNVIRGNPAISLYRRLGFRVVGGNEEKRRMRWDPDRARRRNRSLVRTRAKPCDE